ncbi:MAG: peptidoglycan D,D-transpeptidase FtsI family protein [Candidatus Xenobiia bacterium LiM19]
MKKRIEDIAILYSLLFAALVVYLSFIQIINRDLFYHNENNPRIAEDIRFRGNIYDRKGALLAATRVEKNQPMRVYPMGALLEPILGYCHVRLGNEGIEKYQDSRLKGKKLPENIYEAFSFINGKKLTGRDIYLTIDMDIQKVCADAMEGRKGAVVVLNPLTGEILALVSIPACNPDGIDKNWEKLRKDLSTPLVNRAIDGRYPPGSTFKVFSLAVALELGYVTRDSVFSCPGYFDIGSYRVHEAEGGSHGSVNTEGALVNSCNIAFAQMGLKIGQQNFCAFVKAFCLLDPFNIGVPVRGATFPQPSEMSEGGLAQSAFGQGSIALSPLHLALVFSSIANEGKIMKPFVIKGIRSHDGTDIFTTHPQVWAQPVSSSTADTVKDMMVQVVERGTGYKSRIPGVAVAGKTGTAENPHGESHAWFAAFAPAHDPKYLVVVVVENGGYGGRVAAPIAQSILKFCLEDRKE